MGWALTYKITLAKPLREKDSEAVKRWSEKHFRLEATKPDFSGLESWRGLVPDKVIASARENASQQAEDDSDYRGFVQVRSDAQLRKYVRAFQELEAVLDDAEILLSDDYQLQDARPSDIIVDKRKARARTAEADTEPQVPSEVLAAVQDAMEPPTNEPLGELEELLARARRDFAIWKGRKSE